VPCRHFWQVFRRIPEATINVGLVHSNYHSEAPLPNTAYPLFRSPACAVGLQQGPVLMVRVAHLEPLEVIGLPPMDGGGTRGAAKLHANLFALCKQLAAGESSDLVWGECETPIRARNRI
jgi:hypothetical protein